MTTYQQILDAPKLVYLTAEIFSHFGFHGPIINNKSRAKVESGAENLDCSGCGAPLWVHGKLADEDTPEVFECPLCGEETFNHKTNA